MLNICKFPLVDGFFSLCWASKKMGYFSGGKTPAATGWPGKAYKIPGTFFCGKKTPAATAWPGETYNMYVLARNKYDILVSEAENQELQNSPKRPGLKTEIGITRLSCHRKF